MSLNAQQKKFADEYTKDLNATQSAIRAGYSKKTAGSQGQRLLKKVEIKAYIQAQVDAMHKKSIADAEEVMEFLSKTMRGEITTEELTNTGSVVDVTPALPQRIKAAELIGKRHSLFTDNLNVNSKSDVEIDIGGYEDDD